LGVLDWFQFRHQVAPELDAAPRCSLCADPESAPFDELAADGGKGIYLCRCPACGQYWGGCGYTPQYRLRLSPEEAAQFFPDGCVCD
jgi:hypothetical protein